MSVDACYPKIVEKSGWLIIGVKSGDLILIGELLKLRIYRSAKGQLRLGIQAPKELPISRHENPGGKDAKRGSRQ